jgi:hypothetical protein
MFKLINQEPTLQFLNVNPIIFRKLDRFITVHYLFQVCYNHYGYKKSE